MTIPQTSIPSRLLRLTAVFEATGKSRRTFNEDVVGGLMTKPIKIGTGRAAALPAYEVEAINAARIRGASEAEVKALVAELHARRANAGREGQSQ